MRKFEQVARSLRQRKDFEHGRGASLDEIARAERELNIKFPTSYRGFLATFGWGALGSSEIFGLGDDVPQWLDVIRLTKSEWTEMYPRIPLDLVPILNDGGGNHVCIDTSNRLGQSGSIVFWDHTLGSEQVPEKIAADFSDWLASLL